MTETLNQALSAAISYEAYMRKMEELVANHQTSGPLQTESLVHYTKLNLKRMQRLNKAVKVSEKTLETAKSIPFKTRWVLISEAWCGDAAQNLPFIAALAAQVPKATLEIVFRDSHPEFMDQYLTHGSRSIPKLVIFRAENLEELALWGPRPLEVQAMVDEYKRIVGEKPPFDQFAAKVHLWYTADRNKQLESEIFNIFNTILINQTIKA
jgi:hypothetical protein